MSAQLSTAEGELLFRESERKRNAEALLANRNRKLSWAQVLVSCCASAFLGNIFGEANLGLLARSVGVGLMVAVVGLLFESWNTKRRLEVAIDLLLLLSSQSNQASSSVPNPSFNGTPLGARQFDR